MSQVMIQTKKGITWSYMLGHPIKLHCDETYKKIKNPKPTKGCRNDDDDDDDNKCTKSQKVGKCLLPGTQFPCLFAGTVGPTEILKLYNANTDCSISGPHVAQDANKWHNLQWSGS
jgi:hypothetical protein